VIPGGQILRVPDQGFRRRPKNQFYEGPEIGIACKQSQGKEPVLSQSGGNLPAPGEGLSNAFCHG